MYSAQGHISEPLIAKERIPYLRGSAENLISKFRHKYLITDKKARND
jgi:hypothetical protein